MGAACLAINACGGGDGGGSPAPSSPPPPPPPSATVTGAAARGLLLNAIVSFYPVTDGAAGSTAVASVRTDPATGAYSSPVSSAGPVVVVVTTDAMTKMLDEVSGAAVAAPSGLVLHSVFDSLTNLQPCRGDSADRVGVRPCEGVVRRSYHGEHRRGEQRGGARLSLRAPPCSTRCRST